MWCAKNRAVQIFRHKLSLLRRHTFSSSSSSTTKGLYGFPHLESHKGFQPFVDEAIQRAGELATYISTKPPAAEIMRAMDEISDTVCTVVDSAELCRQTHPDRQFVEEANNASMRMNEYIHYLNTNYDLYDAVKKAEQECHMLSEETQRGLRSFRADMERGVHLSPDQLNRVHILNTKVCQLCTEFITNIVMDPETVGSVLQLPSDDEIRKMVYIQGNSAPHANVDVLKRLISARHELSQITGCRSYAELAVKPNMASSPKVVMSFLLEISKMVRARATEELKLLTKFKREKCGQSDEELRPWDEAYYMTMMKSSVYKFNSSVVASYFSLSNCIEGLKVLVQSLFGATFHSIPLAPGESWDPQVLKLCLHHPDEGDLGYLYLDLYSRKGKYPGCAQFAIKGGRRISQTEYQLPIVALVCNFSGSRNPSAVWLSHWEVDYQYFSGTRTVLDFAEIPSNLFEYYAWDYRVLKTFARHYSTGEEIPEKLVESMQGAKYMFAATDLQHQIFYALVDQTLYGEQPLPFGDSSSVVAELKRKHTNLEHMDGTHWEARFSHFLNYGAGYYSYLYAKCFAATIWNKLCQEDPLSLTTGSALRTKLMQHGGSKEPAALLNDLVADGIYKHHDGGIIPDISSLCEEMKL